MEPAANPICCVPKYDPYDPAIVTARELADRFTAPGEPPHEGVTRLAVMIAKVLPKETAARMGVYFMDNPDAETRRMILDREIGLNAWGKRLGVSFAETADRSTPFRIARHPGQGYYAYLGIDTRTVGLYDCTMNLDSFTSRTPVSEYLRVVKHEGGHWLGFPHEQFRAEEQARLNQPAVIAYYQRMTGWGEETIRQQILATLDPRTFRGSNLPEDASIMMYPFPPELTLDGRGIVGGSDITELDYQFGATVYPPAGPVSPPPPPPGPTKPVSPHPPVLEAVKIANGLFDMLGNLGYKVGK